jgi:hypothetical protein
MEATVADEVLHKLNAYTWAGRRAECAVTAEFLPSVHDWAEVTCDRCLATRENTDINQETT